MSKAARCILLLILPIVIMAASAIPVMPDDIAFVVSKDKAKAVEASRDHPAENDDSVISSEIFYHANEDTYKVTYHANGGIGGYILSGIIPDATETVFDTAEIDITSAIKGLVFVDWNTEADGRGTSYKPGDSIIVFGDISLYAQWKHDGETWYKVAYHPNGGTGNYIASYVAAGRSFAIMTAAAANISRAGYSFTGWNTEADGGGTSYEPLNNIIIKSDMSFYAQYVEEIDHAIDS